MTVRLQCAMQLVHINLEIGNIPIRLLREGCKIWKSSAESVSNRMASD